jgi:hypothetical protein
LVLDGNNYPEIPLKAYNESYNCTLEIFFIELSREFEILSFLEYNLVNLPIKLLFGKVISIPVTNANSQKPAIECRKHDKDRLTDLTATTNKPSNKT